jgi:DNA-binding transcriptional LysR family regulator
MFRKSKSSESSIHENGIVTVPRTTFDIDVLRSFALGVELGSFARAAERLNRSTSAVSAQLKRLEEQAGAPLLRKNGRRLALTETGETMLGYARRLLELNDEAAAAVRGVPLEGRVRLGLQEDFGEHLLPAVLGRFARAHPKLRIEARIARNAELLEGVARGRLDLALAWDTQSNHPHVERLARLPMRWIASTAAPLPRRKGGEPLPLVLLDPPCLVRSTATAALDRAGIPWRIAFSSASLAGNWAAVAAGLGISVRTVLGLPAGVQALTAKEAGLPALPTLGLALHRAEAKPAPAVERLAQIILQDVSAALRR